MDATGIWVSSVIVRLGQICRVIDKKAEDQVSHLIMFTHEELISHLIRKALRHGLQFPRSPTSPPSSLWRWVGFRVGGVEISVFVFASSSSLGADLFASRSSLKSFRLHALQTGSLEIARIHFHSWPRMEIIPLSQSSEPMGTLDPRSAASEEFRVRASLMPSEAETRRIGVRAR